jgi:hypothetical protein
MSCCTPEHLARQARAAARCSVEPSGVLPLSVIDRVILVVLRTVAASCWLNLNASDLFGSWTGLHRLSGYSRGSAHLGHRLVVLGLAAASYHVAQSQRQLL